MPANYDDAALAIQLSRWGTELGLEDAVQAVFSPGFDPDTVSTDNASVTKLLQWGETVATLVKHDILDKALALDMWWITGVWGRVGPAAKRRRAELSEPRLYENFESLATASTDKD
ncbi:MAG: DUF4760 domain-containing protein [Acidimicrobiales bacterium]